MRSLVLVVDFIIVGLTVGAAVWGYLRGVRTGTLVILGFGGGALLGSRVAPLVLDGGLRDPFAPVLALPGALLLGALAAAALERLGFGVRRHLRERGLLDALGGALVAGCVGLVMVWVLAAAAASVGSLGEPLRGSVVIGRLNSLLPPPGPLLTAEKSSDPLPVIAGVRPGVGPASPRIKHDPQVRAAAPSVVKISGIPCLSGGSGWIAGDGIVVTNAHVVEGNDQSGVQVEGKGESHEAEAIWYDRKNDLAILRVPGVSGERALPLDPSPEPGTFAAVLGFPGGGPYKVVPARLGSTTTIPAFRLEGEGVNRQRVTTMRARVRPGNSGGPVVDGRGRVVAVVFASGGGHDAVGVPTPVVQRALRRAGPPVDTGQCKRD
jgi:S1-C subfamily serine protease